jgi:MoxR-like ATPase
MTVTQDQAAWFAQTFDQLVANVGQAVVGKEHVIRLALTCMLSEGHLLLEDYPGTGKTQLAARWRAPCRARTAASSSPPTSSRATSPA